MAKKRENQALPTFDELMKPVVLALVELGGSGTIEEINGKVIEISEIKDEILQIPHGADGARSEVEYRLAWTRTYLKKFGILTNSERGVWSLVKSDITPDDIDSVEIVRTVKESNKSFELQKEESKQPEFSLNVANQVEDIEQWKQNLLERLYTIPPNAFERLAQRLLRESGFIQVEVTGKVGDGGIDGKGIVRVNGLLSFHVIFQCKRYKGSVTPSQIRDFRGAMQGRADKGLFITTGTFTREAIKEATRDGAQPIDLIDGELLCDKLKELGLGIEITEKVSVKEDWFNNL